jgi:hypothetical protein
LKKNSNKASNKTYSFLTDSNIQDLKPSYQQQEQQPKRSGKKEKKAKLQMLILRDREKTSQLRKYQNDISHSLTPLS